MWPLSSRGGVKALVARQLQKDFFAAFLNNLEKLVNNSLTGVAFKNKSFNKYLITNRTKAVQNSLICLE